MIPKNFFSLGVAILQVALDTFNQELLTSTGLVLVDFGAPWCGLCRFIQPITERLSAEWEGAVKVLRVNVDDNFLLSRRYQVRSLPTLILFEKGQEVQRLEHFATRDEVIDRCEQLFLTHLRCLSSGAR
jgi:thioredoxin 1